MEIGRLSSRETGVEEGVTLSHKPLGSAKGLLDERYADKRRSLAKDEDKSSPFKVKDRLRAPITFSLHSLATSGYQHRQQGQKAVALTTILTHLAKLHEICRFLLTKDQIYEIFFSKQHVARDNA